MIMPPNHAQHVGEHGQQRQRDHQRHQLGQHQQLQRRDAQGAHGVDLLGHGHGADLRGIGRARAPGDDDGGDQRRELAQHRQAHQVGHEDVGAVLPQLRGALVGHHDAQQERQQPDDGQRVKARAADVEQDRAPADARRVRQTARQRQRALAHEAEHRQALLAGRSRALADARQGRRCCRRHWCGHRGLGGELLGHHLPQPGEFRPQALQFHRRARVAQALQQLCITHAPAESMAVMPAPSAVAAGRPARPADSSCAATPPRPRAVQSPEKTRLPGVGWAMRRASWAGSHGPPKDR
jgi:hypothetical protein